MNMLAAIPATHSAMVTGNVSRTRKAILDCESC
jgi:hypothetical protein